MENLTISLDKIYDFVKKDQIKGFKKDLEKHNKSLTDKTGKGNDFLGWVDLPSSISEKELKDIQKTANYLKNNVEVVVVIGIGGSYLGAKAVNDALLHSFDILHTSKNPVVLYAGQNLSEDYLFELLEVLKDLSYAIIVISKSGTTTEPAVAFRLLKKQLECQLTKLEVQKRIIAITDESKGALKQLADQEGYKTYVIPDNVGGRYSVLTPVGLLPIAVAGFDIKKLVEGAKKMEELTSVDVKFEDNPAAQYAAARNALYASNKLVEIMVNYNPKLHFLAEWWKQLYGESEGKEGKGIFPASVDFTTDLHSMGQYVQDGQRILFETVLTVANSKHKLIVPKDKEDLDSLNFLSGKRIDEVNKKAEEGTILAHIAGGVPVIKIEIPELNEYYLGQLIYFFEKACALSGYLLNVNPFDQPGVEAYKKNMFILLKKPGYENQKI